jgi:hypothetical protein
MIAAMMGVLPIVGGAVLGCLNVQPPSTMQANDQSLEQVDPHSTMRVSTALYGLPTCQLEVYFVMAMVLDGFFQETGNSAILIGGNRLVGLATFSSNFFGLRLVPSKRRYLVPPTSG